MTMESRTLHLRSRPRHPHGARPVRGVDPEQELELTLVLRHRTPLAKSFHRHLDRSTFAAAHGADPKQLARVQAFLGGLDGVRIDAVSPAARTVIATGPVAAWERAFKVKLQHFVFKDQDYVSHIEAPSLPSDMVGSIEAVLGLDRRRVARPYVQAREVQTANYPTGSFAVPEVASLYDFPEGDGAGQTIGIIELAGGYTPELVKVWLKLHGVSDPQIVDSSVGGGTNPGIGLPSDANVQEVYLDIEVAALVAPAAKLVVYFAADNSSAGFLNVVKAAIHDEQESPNILSISWGGAESSFTESFLDSMDSAFQDAASLGITVTCAAGDQGSSDGEFDGQEHVDFPASSPHTLSCGGTRLSAAEGQSTEEVVWNHGKMIPVSATGGGVSSYFGLPDWQEAAGVPSNPESGQPGRGVPDVAGNGDPETGYQVFVQGLAMVIGGTSAVAPMWAGLIARMNQRRGSSLGFVNPKLYAISSPSAAWQDITQGSNGFYQAQVGWDACTGLGRPIGDALEAALFDDQVPPD